MKTGIVGFGGSGRGHLSAMREVDGIEVKGAFDVSDEAKKEIEKENLKVYRSFEELIEDKEIDFVLISSMSYLHGEQSIKSLKAGKNVIVEKPMATSLKETEEMVKLAKEKNLILTVFHNRRFDPDIIGARQFLEKDLIGKIVYIRNVIFSETPSREGGWRRFKKYGGGTLFDWGSHLIDQVLSLVPSEPEDIIGDLRYIKYFSDEQQDADNHFIIFIKFENKAMAEIGFSRISHLSIPKLYILGEKGTIQAEDWKNGKVIAKYTENEEIKTEKIPEIDTSKHWLENRRMFYTNLLKAFEGKEELLITPESALKVMKVIGKVINEI